MVNIKKSVWQLAIMLLAVWMSNNTYSADVYTAQYYANKGLKSAKHFPGLASLCDISQEPRDMFIVKISSGSGQLCRKNKKASCIQEAFGVLER